MLIELQERENKLLEELREVKKTIRDVKLKNVEKKYGIKIGSIVRDGKGKEFRVTSIDAHWAGRPWLEGNPRKKDRTFGIARRHIYGNWEVISK